MINIYDQNRSLSTDAILNHNANDVLVADTSVKAATLFKSFSPFRASLTSKRLNPNLLFGRETIEHLKALKGQLVGTKKRPEATSAQIQKEEAAAQKIEFILRTFGVKPSSEPKTESKEQILQAAQIAAETGSRPPTPPPRTSKGNSD